MRALSRAGYFGICRNAFLTAAFKIGPSIVLPVFLVKICGQKAAGIVLKQRVYAYGDPA